MAVLSKPDISSLSIVSMNLSRCCYHWVPWCRPRKLSVAAAFSADGAVWRHWQVYGMLDFWLSA